MDAPKPPPKLAVERFADGGIVCLRLAGTIDEGFEGKQLGGSVSGDVLVIDLGGVKKISSFGIREWVDFVSAATKQVQQLFLVECAPKVVDQLNMVANFAGGGRVYSFYAPFRCDYCDSEHRVLLQVDKDHAALRSLKLAERPCPSCKEAMYFDEDGATFFSYVVGQEKFELPAQVAQFLAARLDYAVADLDRKLRVDKLIDGRTTYLRLAGNLDRTFPRDKLADGLEGRVVVDLAALGRIEPAGAAEWRAFVQATAPLVEALYLAAVPPSFLEKLGSREDLGPRGQVLTLTLPYTCGSCGLTQGQLVDVAEHHAVLKFATAPELRCPTCKLAMQCAASEHLMTVLPLLPRPTAPDELVRSITSLRDRASAPARRPTPPSSVGAPAAVSARPRASWVVPFLASLLAVVLAASGFLLYQRVTRPTVDASAVTERSEAAAPAWLTSEPCTVVDGGLACVGTATLSQREAAEDEAAEAAYDELAAAIATRIRDARWQAVVPAQYRSSREAKLGALARSPDSPDARYAVRTARQAVVRALRATGGPAVPAAPVSRYWEQRGAGDGKRVTAYARVVVDRAAVGALIAAYTRTEQALGAHVVSAYPLLAWRSGVERGATIVAVEAGLVKEIGIAPGFTVLAVGGREIADARAFASIAAEEHAAITDRGGTLRFSVQAAEAAPRELVKAIAAPAKPPKPGKGSGSGSGAPTPAGAVNVWDRVGGNRGSAAP